MRERDGPGVAQQGEPNPEDRLYGGRLILQALAVSLPPARPGRKHQRTIELTPWQQELVDLDPRPLIRGLLHSDGCRVLNWVNGTPYPRYHFTNVSADIRGIFGRACDQLGIEWRPNNRYSLSVARRGSVALLDGFVGPKR